MCLLYISVIKDTSVLELGSSHIAAEVASLLTSTEEVMCSAASVRIMQKTTELISSDLGGGPRKNSLNVKAGLLKAAKTFLCVYITVTLVEV